MKERAGDLPVCQPVLPKAFGPLELERDVELRVCVRMLHTVYVIVKPQLGLYLFHLSGFLGEPEREGDAD